MANHPLPLAPHFPVSGSPARSTFCDKQVAFSGVITTLLTASSFFFNIRMPYIPNPELNKWLHCFPWYIAISPARVPTTLSLRLAAPGPLLCPGPLLETAKPTCPNRPLSVGVHHAVAKLSRVIPLSCVIARFCHSVLVHAALCLSFVVNSKVRAPLAQRRKPMATLPFPLSLFPPCMQPYIALVLQQCDSANQHALIHKIASSIRRPTSPPPILRF